MRRAPRSRRRSRPAARAADASQPARATPVATSGARRDAMSSSRPTTTTATPARASAAAGASSAPAPLDQEPASSATSATERRRARSPRRRSTTSGPRSEVTTQMRDPLMPASCSASGELPSASTMQRASSRAGAGAARHGDAQLVATVALERDGDAAAGGMQRERAGNLHGSLERGRPHTADRRLRRRVEQHVQLLARMILELPHRQPAAPRRRAPVHAAKRLTDLVIADAREAVARVRGEGVPHAVALRERQRPRRSQLDELRLDAHATRERRAGRALGRGRARPPAPAPARAGSDRARGARRARRPRADARRAAGGCSDRRVRGSARRASPRRAEARARPRPRPAGAGPPRPAVEAAGTCSGACAGRARRSRRRVATASARASASAASSRVPKAQPTR